MNPVLVSGNMGKQPPVADGIAEVHLRVNHEECSGKRTRSDSVKKNHQSADECVSKDYRGIISDSHIEKVNNYAARKPRHQEFFIFSYFYCLVGKME